MTHDATRQIEVAKAGDRLFVGYSNEGESGGFTYVGDITDQVKTMTAPAENAALVAFESSYGKLRNMDFRAVLDIWLTKLDSFDPNNPEYLDKAVDTDWQMFRAGFLAAHAS